VTPADLAAFLGRVGEVRERCDKATPGPWWADGLASGVRHLERNCDWYTDGLPADKDLPGRQGGDGGQRDGDFIAAARTDLPAALDAVEALVGLLGEAWSMLDSECASFEELSSRISQAIGR
jgi:hypothetical protein